MKIISKDNTEYEIDIAGDEVFITNLTNNDEWMSIIDRILDGTIKKELDYPYKNEEEINKIIIKILENKAFL